MSKEYGQSIEEPEDELEKLIWAESSLSFLQELVDDTWNRYEECLESLNTKGKEERDKFQRSKNSLNFMIKLLQKEIGTKAFVKTNH